MAEKTEDQFPAKSLLQTEALTEYILKTSAYPREHEQLKEMREATRHKYGAMSVQNVAVHEAQFLSMLLKMMNAKRTLEIGVFTGYSLLATALALPQDGEITAIDIDGEAYEFGLQFIRKAGMEHKIKFIQLDAIAVLDQMLSNDEHESEFNFMFVDAAKPSYRELHERAMKLVRVGGIVAYDNTLWFGSIAREEDEVPELLRRNRKPLMDFNAFLSSDRRINLSQVSIGDNISLCRCLY